MLKAQIKVILSQWNSPSLISEINPGYPTPYPPQKLFYDMATINKVLVFNVQSERCPTAYENMLVSSKSSP